MENIKFKIEESLTPPQWMKSNDKSKPVKAINWNKFEDPKMSEIWNRLVANFWVPEKIPLSNDIPSWRNLTDAEKLVITRTFTGLTTLDTLQATVGEPIQIYNAITEHEEHIYTNISFMQAIHGKSYSSIFSTLCSTDQINDAYEWAINNELLQERAKTILEVYLDKDPLKVKVASCLISSFLLYAGFYLPLYLSTNAILPATADIVRLILRDKAIHGYFTGYILQKKLAKESTEKKQEIKDFTYNLIDKLYDLEIRYNSELFKPFGDDFINDALVFSKYNANKCLQNMGYDSKFSNEETEVRADVLSALSPDADETTDFFSSTNTSYIIGTTEETSDDDWDF